MCVADVMTREVQTMLAPAMFREGRSRGVEDVLKIARVGEIMSKAVVTTTPGDDLTRAAGLMRTTRSALFPSWPMAAWSAS